MATIKMLKTPRIMKTRTPAVLSLLDFIIATFLSGENVTGKDALKHLRRNLKTIAIADF